MNNAFRQSYIDTVKLAYNEKKQMLGVPFEWDGKEYIAVAANTDTDNPGIPTGFGNNITYKMSIDLAQFKDNVIPSVNDYIIYNDVNMLIRNIVKPPHNVFWVLDCEVPQVTL